MKCAHYEIYKLSCPNYCMKILLIAEDIGLSAPGHVFRNIAEGISRLCILDIIVSSINSSKNINARKIYNVPLRRFKNRVRTFEYTWFLNDWNDYFWYSKINKQELDVYDFVLSCISFSHFAPLLAGRKIAKYCNCKHVCYSVDAIPAPIGWLPYNKYYQSLTRFIAKHLSMVDALFMTNQEMLDYQSKILNVNSKMKRYVLYNPTYHDSLIKLGKSDDLNLIFIYAGQLYPPRTPDFLLSAFNMLVQEYDNVKLLFIGTKNLESYISNLSEKVKKNIHVLPYQQNLASYYQRCIALIDIGGFIDEDVFLSSKLTSYLSYDRIIICESGYNSPARNIFNSDESIIHCSHNSDELYHAMVYAIKNYKFISYKIRENIIKSFSLKTVSEHLINLLENEV